MKNVFTVLFVIVCVFVVGGVSARAADEIWSLKGSGVSEDVLKGEEALFGAPKRAKDYLKTLLNREGRTQCPRQPFTPDGSVDPLNPAFAVCVADFLQTYQTQYNVKITITSAFRSRIQQKCVCPVAVSGKCGGIGKIVNGEIVGGSNHMRGLAIDVTVGDGNYTRLHNFAKANPQFGIGFPLGMGDRYHIQPLSKSDPKCVTQDHRTIISPDDFDVQQEGEFLYTPAPLSYQSLTPQQLAQNLSTTGYSPSVSGGQTFIDNAPLFQDTSQPGSSSFLSNDTIGTGDSGSFFDALFGTTGTTGGTGSGGFLSFTNPASTDGGGIFNGSTGGTGGSPINTGTGGLGPTAGQSTTGGTVTTGSTAISESVPSCTDTKFFGITLFSSCGGTQAPGTVSNTASGQSDNDGAVTAGDTTGGGGSRTAGTTGSVFADIFGFEVDGSGSSATDYFFARHIPTDERTGAGGSFARNSSTGFTGIQTGEDGGVEAANGNASTDVVIQTAARGVRTGAKYAAVGTLYALSPAVGGIPLVLARTVQEALSRSAPGTF